MSSTNSKENFNVVSSVHFDSGPPNSKLQISAEDADLYETVQEEEWLTRKKVTKTKNKNIETRTQRKLLLEDGEIIADSGPVVTTDVLEDEVVNEVTANENLTPEVGPSTSGQLQERNQWIPVGGSIIISEKTEHLNQSHSVNENKIETEQIDFFGDVTNQEVEEHVAGHCDLKQLTSARQKQNNRQLIGSSDKRIVSESTKKYGTIDTQDVKETSRVQDGLVVTETERTTQHEDFENESLPHSGSSMSDGSVHEETKETQHNIVHTKDEDLVEYYAVPKGGNLNQGVKLGEGMHVVSEDFQEAKEGGEVDSLSERLKRTRRLAGGLGNLKEHQTTVRESPERTDALTLQPLDYQEEEKNRKHETNKWLESHFGSDSGNSNSSLHEDNDHSLSVTSPGINVITIRMDSRSSPSAQDIIDSTSRYRTTCTTYPSDSVKVHKNPPPPPKNFYGKSRIQSHSNNINDNSINVLIGQSDTAPDYNSLPPKLRNTVQDFNQIDNGVSESQYTIRPTARTGSFSSHHPISPLHDSYNNNFREKSSCTDNNDSYLNKNDSQPLYSTPIKKNFRKQQSSKNDIIPCSVYPASTSSIIVNRSQSFNVDSNRYLNKERTDFVTSGINENRRNDYKSFEQLNSVTGRTPLIRHWPPPPGREPSPELHRDPTPPPRYRSSNAVSYNYPSISGESLSSRHIKEMAVLAAAREATTQTSSRPIPPPRRKRNAKIQNNSSYYFGQGSPSGELKTRTSFSPTNNSHNMKGTSPQLERRFTSLKSNTQTHPSLNSNTEQIVYKEHKSKNHSSYQSSLEHMGTPQSSWTNTVDLRRRPYNYNKENNEPEQHVFPKVSKKESSVSPRKTYYFGEEQSKVNDFNSNNSGSVKNTSKENRFIDKSNNEHRTIHSLRSSKPIGRSSSLNVRPISVTLDRPNKHSMKHIEERIHSGHKTSQLYQSTPYLNLRSPNMIATIVRTASMKQLDNTDKVGVQHSNIAETKKKPHQQESFEAEKRNHFMKGLLNTAPELFSFIHGNEEENVSTQQERKVSSQSPDYSQNAETQPLVPSRSSKHHKSSTSNDVVVNEKSQLKYSSSLNTYPLSSSTQSLNRPKFNLKSGGSLLYSNSFRNGSSPKAENSPPPWEHRRHSGSDMNLNKSKDASKSTRGIVSSSIQQQHYLPSSVHLNREFNSR